MKNKAVTYMLILVVALVWGIIIYRIIGAAGSDDDVPVVTRSAIQKIRTEDYAEAKDTTHLLLNYPNPFVKDEPKILKLTERPVALPKNKSLIRVTNPVNWGFINYSGFVRNARSKKILTILSINGKSYTLSDGESAENVKLVKNMTDSVRVLYRGKLKSLIMNSPK